MKLIKNIIQKLISEEKKFCFEMHNMLSWYFSIEHPAPQPSSRGKNPFFEKYGFLILKDIDKRGVEHEKVLEFLNDIIENKNYKIILMMEILLSLIQIRLIFLNKANF
jgi:hypothetical protein